MPSISTAASVNDECDGDAPLESGHAQSGQQIIAFSSPYGKRR
jgi:hypothetical protein